MEDFNKNNLDSYPSYYRGIDFFEQSEEVWIDVPHFEGLYQISSKYRFKSLARRVKSGFGRTRSISEIILKVNLSSLYPTVSLWRGNKSRTTKVHIIVAKICYLNPEKKPEVNHIDGNKFNYHYSNLEWNTSSENKLHALRTGLRTPKGAKGGLNARAKLTPVHVKTIRNCFETGKYTKTFLGKLFSVHPSVITDIIMRKIWKEVA